MLIGQHFGKRKPRWNFFNDQLKSIIHRHNLRIKITLFAALIQALILSPIIYWSLQNYIFITKNIPYHYRIHSYIESEKNWIIILYIVCLILSTIFNYYITGLITQTAIDYRTLLDEAEDQHHAS